jgi:hypothetical protein
MVSGGVTQEFEGVFDPVSGQLLDISEEETIAHQWPPPSDDFDDDIIDVDFGGDFLVIRPVQDVEFTYGIGNTYSLVRGRRYRVSREIASHLIGKQLAERVGR